MTNVAQLPQVVDTRYTQDVIPVLDTSKFEHMQRIALIMAASSVIPESLRYGKQKDASGKTFEAEFPRDVVIANCFRIVNQAVRWGMDPFAVADCASIVHGRLMWEGKLIAAVLEAKLGVRLSYQFTGEDAPIKDKALGVIVSGTLPGEVSARTIEGTVSDWHKGDKSPWANPGAWKRQLRYMGAREWARAHAPAVMLGIYTDDEFDSMMARDVPSGRRAVRLKDVTPPKPVPALPDIPDIPDESTPADDDCPIADVDGYLAKLREERGYCQSVDDLADLREANADLIARLPKAQQDAANEILAEAAE